MTRFVSWLLWRIGYPLFMESPNDSLRERLGWWMLAKHDRLEAARLERRQ